MLLLALTAVLMEGGAEATTSSYLDSDIRYIDYESGNDGNPGTRESPWKHHPWDQSAAGKAAVARGVHTYVFKQGVIYRGFLDATESGDKDAPITLTIEPGWGQGDAVLAGSQSYSSGWQPCDAGTLKKFPEDSRSRLWCRKTRTDQEPRLVWEKSKSGISRLPIARSPNWKIIDQDDPRSQWFESSDVIVEIPVDVDSTDGISIGDTLAVLSDKLDYIGLNGREAKSLIKVVNIDRNHLVIGVRGWHAGLMRAGDVLSNGVTGKKIRKIGDSHSITSRIIDAINLGSSETDAYAGATIWAERRSMPKADAAIIASSNPDEKSIRAKFHRAAGAGPMQYDRYYLEGLPEFLDSAGEYIYQKTDKQSGVLALRLPEDRDPNKSIIEVASSLVVLQIKNHSNIHISGLNFWFSNQLPPGTAQARHSSLYASAVQIRGDVNNITISNCDFSYLPAGVVVFPEDRPSPSTLDNIVISDSTFSEIDGSPVVLGNGQSHYKLKTNGSRLIHVAILRNKLESMGYRTLGHFGVGSHGDGIQVMGGEVVEVAGNQVDRVWGSGISVALGSDYESGQVERPFLRGLVHDNIVVNSLLGAQDGGGINAWMGGPSYLYNNISGNPVGCIYSRHKTTTRKNWYRRGCYGVGIYLDGQYKGYVFNNIVWGTNNNANDRFYNSAGLNEAMGFMHTVFNNTFYRFATGLHKGMYQHNRNYYLANLFIDMGLSYIDQEPKDDTIDYATLAYSKNQFYGKTAWFGKLGMRSSDRYKDLTGWQNAMRSHKLMRYDTGKLITSQPVKNAERHDFMPLEDSPAIDAGARVFVPWALYGVVGEWHFLRRNADPAIIDGENINMNVEWVRREMFDRIPRHDLRCVNTDIADFEEGVLEDWIPGALRFDGATRFCELRNSKFAQASFDMGENNFLVEIVVAPANNAVKAGLMEKRGDRGYSLDMDSRGRIRFLMDYGNESSQRTSQESINDGMWHHVVVDVNRTKPDGIIIYIDGKLSIGEWSGVPMRTMSLSNNGGFLVGRSEEGMFTGRIDFLRLSRGTLAEAETDIHELYDWEFNGPFLRDIYGSSPVAKRDAGAVEYLPDG